MRGAIADKIIKKRMKPVLKYPGSKWRIAGEIVARIPEHHTYLEPFFGSGAVFFSKEPSRIEMINDLDNNVPNLFRCIRDDPDRLARIVATTPYSRHEYERAFASNEERDNFQRAADFLTTCWQGHGFRTNGTGWAGRTIYTVGRVCMLSGTGTICRRLSWRLQNACGVSR